MEDFETAETQYSANVHNFVSMLASLMCHQVKDNHHHLIYIFLQLHPDFLYAFSLLSLTLANLSFSAFLLAV